MPCECTIYTCIEAFINPCSEGVELDIVSDYTGNMTGRVWFNGTVTSFGISVTDGERIILPVTLFNENYAHEMRLYDEDGELIECYRVKTYVDYDSGEFTPTPPAAGALDGASFPGNNTDTQTFAGLNGNTLLTITMGGQDYNGDFWTQTGGQVAWLPALGMTFTGTVTLIWSTT